MDVFLPGLKIRVVVNMSTSSCRAVCSGGNLQLATIIHDHASMPADEDCEAGSRGTTTCSPRSESSPSPPNKIDTVGEVIALILFFLVILAIVAYVKQRDKESELQRQQPGYSTEIGAHGGGGDGGDGGGGGCGGDGGGDGGGGDGGGD